MAILNITDDSFSDGGLFIDFESSIRHASLCVKQGAKVLDLGAQSTRPGASEVGAEIEIKRLIPVIKELKLIHPEIPISGWINFSSLITGISLLISISGPTSNAPGLVL